MSKKNIQESLVKSLIVGGIGYGASFALFGDSRVPFMGQNISSSVAVAGAVGGASFAGNFVAPYVLNALPQPKGLVKTENMLINPALTALGAYAVGKMMGDVRPLPLMAVGAGSEVAGSYGYATIAPMIFGSQDETQDAESSISMEYF